jgi:predicted GNAT superfamily acetyltransferase
MPRASRRGTIVAMSRSQLEAPHATEVAGEAAAAAGSAAERAGVVVRPLESLSELDAGSRLISRIWSDGDGEPKAPTSLLRALSYAGNFVAGAFRDGELVGVSLGFFGFEESELHLHSHITGVDPEFQGKSLGFALKQFQRSWTLERGARTILWTADPLVRGNAFFNLVKLGAVMVDYHENFYGLLEDGLNAGGDSDRVVLRWDLASERSVRAAAGALGEPRAGDGCVVLRAGDDGGPVTSNAEGDVLLAWVPEDIVRVREGDPERARAWRRALRETVGRPLSEGFHADAITRDGWLTLTR